MKRWLPFYVGTALLGGAMALAGTPAPVATETPLDTAKRLAGSAKSEERVQALQSLRVLAKPGEPEGDEALARYGDLCLRFHAGGEKNALAEAKRAFTELKEKSHSRWGIWGKLGLWQVEALEGKRLRAISGLDQYLAQQDGGDSAVDAACYLGSLLSEDKENLESLQRAQTAFKYALHLLKPRGASYYAGMTSEDEIKRKLHALGPDIERLTLGEDFLLYRQAEAWRRSGREFDKAREIYLKIAAKYPTTMYAEASRCYAPLCLVGLGKPDEAQRELWGFYQKDNYGLYRGEALLELGKIELERRVRPFEARKYFSLLNDWFERARKEVPQGETGVKPAAERLVAPPKSEKETDFWGNVKKRGIVPGQLVNQRTCSWYLDDLEEKCAGFRGFLYFAEGKKEDALKCYEKILQCDKETKQMEASGIWNDYSRLKWGAEHGYLYAYPQELALYQGQQRFAVLLGDFYFCTERFGEARKIYERLLAAEFGKLSPEARDYPLFALAACSYWTGDRKKAFDEYLKVLEKRDGTLAELRAMYAAGNISADIDDEAIRAKGLGLLRDLALSGNANDFTYQAMILYGKRLVESGRKQEGILVLRSVPYAAAEYRELAQFYLNEYEKAEKQREGSNG